MTLRVRVLGSAAGGGAPQWNCACTNCRRARRGELALASRLQDSLAVSADGERWLLLNASPDVRAQIESTPSLWPRSARDTPIAAVALTNGDLDHVLGLFALRESQPLALFASGAVQGGLTRYNVMCRTLERFPGHSCWNTLEAGRALEVCSADGMSLGLSVECVPVAGKLPIHLSGLRAPDALDNVGLLVRDLRSDRSLSYFPSVAEPSPALAVALGCADLSFFDGTFYTSDELSGCGVGTARAEDMAHWPLSGDGGSLAWLTRLEPSRTYLTHINNTNPILDRGSAEHAIVRELGLAVAEDGLELEL